VRIYLSIVIAAGFFLGCSQDNQKSSETKERKSQTQESHKVVKVEQKIIKRADKEEVLVCLDEEDKITCKLMTKRLNKNRTVEFVWNPPSGNDKRERTMTLPANHASIYDTRDKKGREKGKWVVEATIGGEEVSTTFIID